MSNYENKSITESINTKCPECEHEFDVDVEIDVEVESQDPYITIKAK